MTLADEEFNHLYYRKWDMATLNTLSRLIVELAIEGKCVTIHLVDHTFNHIEIEECDRYDPYKDASYGLAQTRIKSILLTLAYPIDCNIITGVENNRLYITFYTRKTVKI